MKRYNTKSIAEIGIGQGLFNVIMLSEDSLEKEFNLFQQDLISNEANQSINLIISDVDFNNKEKLIKHLLKKFYEEVSEDSEQDVLEFVNILFEVKHDGFPDLTIYVED